MEKITLAKLGAPLVVLENTQTWEPGRNFIVRRYNEIKIMEEVLFWLHMLGLRYKLDLNLSVGENIVEVIYNGEKVAYFCYIETGYGVYKMQDFTKLLELIETKTKA